MNANAAIVWDALAMLALLAAIFVPLERAFPAVRGQALLRRHVWLDLTFFCGQALLFRFAIFAVLSWLYVRCGGALPPAVLAAFASQPFWLRVVEVVMLGDLCAYWGHRLQHAWEPLWRFHAVHHSAESLDWLAAHREHPLDGLYTQCLLNLPILVSGFSLKGAAGIVAFRAIWAVFIHSNVRIPLGPLTWLLGSPALHHWHHERSRETCNYGNLSPWTDLMFGTYACPAREPPALGLETPLTGGYLRMLLDPLRPRALGHRAAPTAADAESVAS